MGFTFSVAALVSSFAISILDVRCLDSAALTWLEWTSHFLWQLLIVFSVSPSTY
jgi:hypothetical protein